MTKTYTKNTWTDEVLGGAERYDIKENGGAAFKSNMQIDLVTPVAVAGTPVNASRMNNLENGVDTLDDALNVYTTGGTSTAYTLTTPKASALTTGEMWRVKFHATAGTTPTLNRDSKGAKSLKYYSAGSKVAITSTTIYAGMVCDVYYDGTDYVVLISAGVTDHTLLSNIGTNTHATIDTHLASTSNPHSVTALQTKAIPEGWLINGYISRTVASNNITVAVKTLAGANPSAGDPVYIRIGNTLRSITAALSVTKNAATNWFNAGSSELATQEIDYFVYVGYNATDGIVLGFARIPWARTYSDFSTTSTNEKYCAISTITNAASTDNYVVVGRFNAKLSASSAYQWSVPATDITVNHPTLETRWMNWAPAYSASGSMTWTSVSTTAARYMFDGDHMMFVQLYASGTTGGTASNVLRATLPFTPVNDGMTIGAAFTNGVFGGSYLNVAGKQVYVVKYDLSNMSLGTVGVITDGPVEI